MSKALEVLKNETYETLTKRGRGAYLEQLCLWAGLSEYGTAKEKANRLLKWYEVSK